MLLKPIQRFLNKIEIDKNGCWVWIAYRDSAGYSKFGFNKTIGMAHRFIWLYFYGKIPKSLEIDHLCRTRACVNVAHLELVTHNENLKRGNSISTICAKKTHCPKGHPLNGSNLHNQKDGKRRCRICHNQYLRDWRKLHPFYHRRYIQQSKHL